LFYKNADLSVLRESKRDIIKEYISNKKLKISQIKKLYEIAINPSSAATIDEFINTQRLK
jgi:hypothetical protein